MSPINDGTPSGLQCRFEGGVLKVSWTASFIPDGYSAVLTLTDSQDHPLSPAPQIVISGAEATVSGPAIQPHATLKVRLRAISPAAGPQTIELVELSAPAAPQLAFGAAGLDIRWNSIQDALGYSLDLTDHVGGPIAPQPPVVWFGPSDSCHAQIAFDHLPDLANWQVRVRATANNSLGPWSAASAVTIDKSQPLSPLLQALLARLKAAGATFSLGPEIVQSGKVTGQFQSLLGVANSTLAVRDASVRSTLSSITLNATLDLFHVRGAIGEFVFTDQKAIIELDLHYPLGRCSIAQLKTAGLLPDDVFGDTDWVNTLASLENLSLELDTAVYKVTVSGPTGATWSILGLPGVTTKSIQPQLEVYAPQNTSPKRYVPRVMTALDVGGAERIPVYLQLPVGYTPWEVGLTQPWYAGNLTSIYSLFGGQALSLPDGLVSLGQLTLESFRVTHAPDSSTWSWDLVATLGRIPGQNNSTPPRWKIIKDVLELESLSAHLRVDVIKAAGFAASTSGEVAARFVLGTLDPFDAVLRVPGSDGTWALSIATSRTLALSQTAQLLGGSTDALDTALARVGATSGFTLQGLEVEFKPDVPELTRFSIALSLDSWTVPSLSWFQVMQVNAQLTVVDPLQKQTARVITGSLDALLTLGSVQVGVIASFDQSAVWKLRIGAQAAQLESLADLSPITDANTITGNIPTGLPTGGGFEMGAFGFDYDSQAHYFPHISFALKSSLDWEIIPQLYTLNNIDIAIDIKKSGPSAVQVVTGSVVGRMTLAGVEFVLRANKPDDGGPWVLSGALENQVVLDFTTLLHEQISADWSLPSGFPTALTIVAAELDLTPDTGRFEFIGGAVLDWTFNIGAASFALKSIGATIHRAGRGDTTPTNAVLYGSFDFGGTITADATVRLGAHGIDTVVQVGLLAAADASRLEVPALADRLSGATGAAQFAQIIPANLPVALADITATVNLTRNLFVLTGTLTGYAWAYLLFRSAAPPGPPENNPAVPEYLFAAGLGQNFRFGNLLSALAPVDDIVTVQDARMAVYSVAVNDLPGLKQAVDQMTGLRAPLTWPLPDTTGIELPPERGLVLAAQISLHTSKLFDNVLQIGKLGSNPNLCVIAVIDRANTVQSLYSVSLPDIVILDTIRLSRGTATFRPSNNREVKLAGDLIFQDIFGQNFGFHGELTMTSASLLGQLSLLPANSSQTVNMPFSLPGIAIEQLAMEVHYTFATSGPSRTQTSSRFTLLGRVRLGRPPEPGAADQRALFTTRLALQKGKPVLLSIALDKNLDVGAFLAQCFTGDGGNWPTTFIDIVFKSGSRVYYYSSAGDPAAAWKTDSETGYQYRDGFNIDAAIDLTLVTTISFRLTIQAVKTDNQYTGITGQVGLDNTIDLLFISLASQTQVNNVYTGGPQLTIATGAQPRFGLAGGINFLGRAMVAASAGVLRTPQGDTVVDGAIETAESFDPFGKLSFRFTYTRTHDGNNQFRIRDWPDFAWARQILDIIKLIRQVANVDGAQYCGKLVNLVATDLLQTNYRVRPSAESEGNDLVFSLTVSCQMSIRGASAPFLTRPLPPIKMPIAKKTRFDELPGAMAQSIVQAGPAFVADLLKQPDQIALFLAMTFGQTGVEIALDLVCRGLVDAGVPAAVEAGAAAIAAEGGAAAAGAAAAATTAIGAAIAAAGGGGTGGGGTGGGGAGGGGGSITVGKPVLSDAHYASGQVVGRWSAANYAASYNFQFLSGSRVVCDADQGLALAGTLPLLAADVAAGTYQARVVAVRNNQSNASDSKPITKLAAPAVQLSYADGVLRATISGSGDCFSITFYGPDGQALGSSQNVPASNPHGKLTLPLPRGASYGAAAQALSSGQIPSDLSARASLTLLGKPRGLTVHQQAAQLSVSWQAVSGAAYSVRLLDNGVVQGTPKTDITTPGTTLDLPATTPGKVWQVEVRATNAEQSGDWSDAVTILLLAIPAGLELLYDASQSAVVARWQTLAGADFNYTYDFELLNQQGDILGTQQTGLTTSSATVPVASSVAACRGQVRASVGGSFGLWSPQVALQIVVLPAPTDLRLSFDGATGQLNATWARPASVPAATYDLQVMETTTKTVLVSRTGLTVAQATIGPPELAAQTGVSYTVRVRLVTTSAISDWSAASIILGTVTVALAAVGAKLQASWSGIDSADFEILVTHEGAADIPLSVSAKSYTFDPPGPGAYSIKVRVKGDGAHVPGPWSDPSNTVYVPSGIVVTLVYDFKTSKLAATWNPVFPPPYPGFSAHLFKDGQEILKVGVDGRQTNFDLSGPGIYTVRVQQLGDSTHLSGQLSKPSQPVTVAGEVTVTLAYQNEKIVVAWNDLKAPNYKVELLKDDKNLIQEWTSYPRFEFVHYGGAGIYTARVHPNSHYNFFGGGWSKLSNPLTQLNPPSGAIVTAKREDKVFVACEYEGDCYDTQLALNGTPFGPIATSVRGQPPQPLSAKGLDPGEYWVRLRSRYQDDHAVPSDWTYARAPFYRLAAPTITALSLSTDKLKRGFVIVQLQSTVSNAERYLAQFVMAANHEPVGTVFTFRNGNIELPSNDLAMGTYQVQVSAGRAQSDGFASEWALSTMTLDLPTIALEKNSLRVDGKGSAVIPLDAPLDLDDCTVEAWVHTSQAGSGATVFNCDSAFYLGVVDGAIVFYQQRKGGSYSAGVKSYVQAVDGKWHHVAAVRRNSGNVKLYLDGSPVKTYESGQVSGFLSCEVRITIGALQPENSSNRFIGMLGELRIWNLARKSQDIQQTMRTVLDPTDPTLLLYYNFHDGAGRELTGRGADLVLQGSAEIVHSDIPVLPAPPSPPSDLGGIVR